MNKQSCASVNIFTTIVNESSSTKLTKLKKLKSLSMETLQEDGVLQMQTMLTIYYHGLVLVYVMQTVVWFGAANSKLILLYQLLKRNTLQCHMLFGITHFQFKTLSRRLAISFFCHTQLQTFASQFMRTTFPLYQWQNHWNSLLTQNTMRLSIITFAANKSGDIKLEYISTKQ